MSTQSLTGDVSIPRLYVLRAAYLLMAVGLAVMIGPLLIDAPTNVAHPRGVMWSLLGGVGLLALLGIRHPLRMLPLLIFELVWKALWLVAIWLPMWRAGTLGPAERASFVDCVFGVVLVLVVVPWPYFIRHFLRGPGDPWRPWRERRESGAAT